MLQKNSTIFKTYSTSLDDIRSKLGFNKRSFAEWQKQVVQSFSDANNKLNGFKKAIVTAFNAPAKSQEKQLISETDFSSVFSGFNANDFFNFFNENGSQSLSTLTQWCNQFKNMDDTMRSYLVDCMQKQVPASYDGYNTYVQQAIASTNQLTFSAKASKLAFQGIATLGNMAAFTAISKVIEFAVTQIENTINRIDIANEEMKDAVNVYEETKNEIENLNNELNTTAQRIDELNAKQNLSFVEQEELSNLKESNNELERRLHLLEQQEITDQKSAAVSAVNAVTTEFGESPISGNTYDSSNKNWTAYELATAAMHSNDNDSLLAAYKGAQARQKQAETTPYAERTYADTVDYKPIISDIKEMLLSNLSDLYDQKDAMSDYYNRIKDLDVSLLDDEDLSVIQQYERVVADIDAIYKAIDPATFKTDALEKILDKTVFKDQTDTLMKLGENGTLSVSGLITEFPELIAYLKTAGLTAQDLYQYIMALSNPDAVNYDAVSQQLMNSIGIDGTLDSKAEAQLWEIARSAGITTHEGLEAYLTVKSKYSEAEREYWDVYDWIAHIQEVLDTGNLNGTINLSGLSEEQSQAIDNFQSNISSLQSSIEGVSNLSSSEIIDLMQEFSDFDWKKYGVTGAKGVGDLDAALRALVIQQKDTIVEMLREANAGEDLIQTFELMADQAIYATEGMDKVTSSLSDVASAYNTVLSALNDYTETGSMSIDNATALLNLDDAYLAALVDENGQLAITNNTYRSLIDARLDEAGAQATQQALRDIESITSEAGAIQYLSNKNYALANSLYDTAGAYASVQAAAQNALAQQGITDTQATAIKGIQDAYYARMAIINAARDSINSNGLSGSGSQDTYEELVDFFDRRIKVLDDANNLLESNLKNVAGSYAKNTLIDSQLGIAEERFRNYSEAIRMYTEKADDALSKLSPDLAEKVKNGSVSMTDFIGSGNEDVVEAIKDYENWSDKVADCKQELAELKENLRQLELNKFNNIIEDFTNQFDIHESANELIDKQISLFEEAGELIGESFYTTQIEESQKQLNLLEKEKNALVNQLNSTLSSGRIQAGTDEWLEMVNALSDVDGSILDCKTSMEKLDNAILDLHTELFERVQEQFSNLNSELENLYGLFDEDAAVTDGNQNWTDAAIAQLGLLAQQYELSQYQIQQYDKEIEQLNADYLNGKYSAIEYTDKLADLSSAQWDAVNSSESIKDSIIDLHQTRIDEIVDGIEEEINAYQELTNAQIDTLKAEKELHDYEESIAEKTNSVTKLERQIAAMKNDTTAATVAKRLQLEEELAQAKKELEDTEYEHFITSQEEALNQQYEDYETARNDEITALQESLLNKEDILAQSFETVKQNSTIVGEQITMIAQQHGVRISNALISAWTNGENAIASYGTTLSAHSSAFILSIMGVETEIWDLQNQANITAGTLANMFSAKADNLIQQLTDSWTSADTLNTMADTLQQTLRDTLEGNYSIDSIASSFSTITEKANEAAAAIEQLLQELAFGNGWAITTQDGKTRLSKIFTTKEEALSWAASYSRVNGVPVTLKQYAKGTRNANAGLRVINEQGYELVLPKLSSGNYALGNAGDQILTKAQTDNLFDWAQINPDIYSLQNLVTPTLPPLKAESSPVTINYDSLVRVDGDVNNSNIKQIQAVVQDGLKQFAIQVNRDYRYGRK